MIGDWVQLILAVQFMGLVPLKSQAIKYETLSDSIFNENLPGTVLVKYFHDVEPICSGTLLKPWIVLTTAECVQEKEMFKLAVTVWYTEGNLTSSSFIDSTDVNVNRIYIEPNYKKGEPENNYALLIIYSQSNWTVGEYSIPLYVPLDGTYVYLWVTHDHENYSSTLVPVSVVNGMLCGLTPDMKDWYCVVNKNPPAFEYSQVDFGSPLFSVVSGVKFCFGLFTGYASQPPFAPVAHIYQEVLHNFYWINNIITQNSVPPV